MRAILEVETVIDGVQEREGPRAGCEDCPRGRPECRRCPIAEAEGRKVIARFSADVITAAGAALRAHRRYPPPRKRPPYWTPAFARLVGYAALEVAIYKESRRRAAAQPGA